MQEIVNEVLNFWFGRSDSETMNKMSNWWVENAKFDNEINNKFQSIYNEACAGKLQSWLEEPKSCLAYIIVLDQFSRNLHRNHSDAFAQDDAAVEASQYGREKKWDKALSFIERQFLYMPYMHSESIAVQKLSVILFKQLAKEASDQESIFSEPLQLGVKAAIMHHDIIATYNRFPHRNAVLGRLNTEAEQQYLDEGFKLV